MKRANWRGASWQTRPCRLPPASVSLWSSETGRQTRCLNAKSPSPHPFWPVKTPARVQQRLRSDGRPSGAASKPHAGSERAAGAMRRSVYVGSNVSIR